MLSEKTINHIVDKVKGFFRPEQIDSLLKIFEIETDKFIIDSQSEANLLRIIDSLFDKVSFFTEALKYPHHIEIITAAAASSNFLTDIIVRNPEFLHQVFDEDYLDKKIKFGRMNEEIEKSLANYRTFESKLRFLKSFKRRMILKIGLNDILKNASLIETYEAISITAQVLLGHLFSICVNEQLNKNGSKKILPIYSVVSLGKLGGGELNYSSDVDLIVVYDRPESDYDNEITFDLLNESIQKFIAASSEVDQNGFLYRLDFRLRPDGKHSPLCRTLNDYLRYYEIRGEDWERQMLIKVGLLSGSKNLFDRFYNYIQNYVYPSSSYKSPFEQIRRMKQNIESGIYNQLNIKLFSGGIRDIEFAVQALQLLYGGKKKNIKTGNTLAAIDKLKDAELLSNNEAKVLHDSYIFYRKIEHFLQLMNNTQSHTIPEDMGMKNKLVRYLDLKSVRELETIINAKRKRVRKIFNEIIGSGSRQNNEFEKINFSDRKKAERNYRFIKYGEGLITTKSFERNSIEKFERIEPLFISLLNKSIDPDLLLQNFSNFIKWVSFPSIWYKQFENKFILSNFLKLCAFSAYAFDLLLQDKSNSDLLLTGLVFDKTKNDFQDYSLKTVLFILSVRYSLGIITRKQFSHRLTSYIDLYLQKAFEKLSGLYNFSLIGLGSLGTRELTSNSDLDIIILVDKFKDFEKTQNDFINAIDELRKTLNPFRIDSRLKPEGKSSFIVWDIEGYEKYFETRVRVWEMLAFSKSRFIVGDKKLYKKFIKLFVNKINSISRQEYFSELKSMQLKIRSEGTHTYSNVLNIKKSSGGLYDIDYLIGFLTLTNDKINKKLIGKGNSKRVSAIINSQKQFSQISPLGKNEEFLRKLDLSCKMMKVNCSKIYSEKKLTASLEKNYFRGKKLINSLDSVLKENREIFKNHFKI